MEMDQIRKCLGSLVVLLIGQLCFTSFSYAQTICDEIEQKKSFIEFDQIKLIGSSLIFVQDRVENRQSMVSAKLVSEAEFIKFVKGSQITHFEILSKDDTSSMTTEDSFGFILRQIKHQQFRGKNILCSELSLR
jgi:hypothetical protein